MPNLLTPDTGKGRVKKGRVAILKDKVKSAIGVKNTPVKEEEVRKSWNQAVTKVMISNQ